MTSKPLTGLRVLLVEDDYYLAADATSAVEDAGGEVIGPFGSAEQALDLLSANGADVAVLDINLGYGPSFDLARRLRTTNVPIVFATGYDEGVLPEDLQTVARLQKPYRSQDLVQCLSSVKAEERY